MIDENKNETSIITSGEKIVCISVTGHGFVLAMQIMMTAIAGNFTITKMGKVEEV